MSITYLKSVLSRVFVIFLVFSAEAYAADFYYSWNNTPYGSLQEACDASIEYINSSGHNFSYDDVLLDECPKGDNVHCATCLARQDKYPYTATLTIASKLAAFRLGHPLDDTLQQCTVGNPIDPVTGNKIQYEPLIKIEAIQPIEFYLVYNSQRIEKWRHSYNRTLSFSASAAGKRIDFNGAPFGSKPTAESESVSLLGGKSTYPGIYYAAPDKDLTVTYPSQKAACESGWINTKKFFHYSWVPGSVAEYRPDRVNLCYILDEPAGRIKMILDIYEVLSGKKFSYGPPPDDSYLRFTRQNGRVIVFRKYPFTYNLSGTGETLEITGTGNDTLYRLTTAEDEIEVYDANGRLLSVSNRQGMTQSLVYETGTGLLSSVSSQTGESIRFAYESYGENLQYTRIKSVTDHSGRQWLFDYDPATDVLASITFPDNGQRRYHYEDPDDPQLLTGITDQSGMRYASWEYDAKGRATLSAHGQTKDKDRVELSYLGNGLRLVTKKRISGFPDGNALDIPYNYLTHVGAGKPLVAEIGGNVSLKYEYDAMTGYLDYKIENNVRTEFKNYNSSGNPGIVVEAAGTPQQRTTVYTYDSRYIDKLAVRKEPSVVPGKLKTTRYEYDDFGNNTAIITSGFRPDGTAVSRVTTFEYNGPFHQLTKIDGPRTDVSDIYTIDYYPDDAAQGSNRARMKRVTAPLNITLYDSITYTSTGNIQSYTDANGVQTTLSYYYGNDRLQTLSQLDINTGVQRITEWTYLATGEVKTITTGSDIADKTTLTLNYDDARRLTSIVDGLGNTIEYILDSEGNVEQENIKDNTGAFKKQLTQIFDDYNRLQLRTQVNESYTETWSPDGTLAMTVDGKNVTTDYSYDNLRRLTQINQDMGGTSPQTANAITILNYDIQDNLTYVKNPVNGETTYTYDDLGNQLTRSSDDTGLTVYEYDDAGNIISMIDANGETTLYTYDALNRLTSITTSSPDDSYQLAYDNCNNGAGRLCMVSGLTSTQYYSYNAFGDIISQQGLQYSYDTAGRLKTITYPSLAVVRYDYDAAGQVQQVSLERNGSMVPLASDITYDPFGDINALLYGNALTLSQSRDAAYRPLSQEILGVFNLNYVNYDANGNLLQRNDGISNQSSLFSYDAHNRLVFAAGEFGGITYKYDKNANRTNITRNGVSTDSSYEPSSNRLSMRGVDNAVLDDNGNLLSLGSRNYEYTRHNRLFRVYDNGDLKATYQYNGLGQRISKTLADGSGRYFVYDTDGKLMAEMDINGNILFEYIYLNGKLLAKYTPDSDSDGISNYEEDRAGTNPVSVDTDGDGLSDIQEIFQYGTRIDLADSDNDGVSDSQEVAFNSNPLDADINYGDINLNGEFNLGDYTVLMQFVLGIKTPSPTEQQQADINQDGILNVQDMLLMQRVLLGQQLSWLDFSIERAQQVFVRLYDSLIPQAYAALGDGKIYYVHNDHLGTPVKMTNELGFVVWQAVYNPFGKAVVDEDVDGDGKAIEMNVRFPGQYYDAETGLHYNYFRTYDPELGRYLTSDPIGLGGGLNTYAYVYNSPLNYTDPTGEGVYGGAACVFAFMAYSHYGDTQSLNNSARLGELNATIIDLRTQLQKINNEEKLGDQCNTKYNSFLRNLIEKTLADAINEKNQLEQQFDPTGLSSLAINVIGAGVCGLVTIFSPI